MRQTRENPEFPKSATNFDSSRYSNLSILSIRRIELFPNNLLGGFCTHEASVFEITVNNYPRKGRQSVANFREKIVLSHMEVQTHSSTKLPA